MNISCRKNLKNMGWIYSLQPHSLPNTGYRRIPDTFRLQLLLATGNWLRIRRVDNSNLNKLRTTFSQQFGYIERERIIPPFMNARQFVVYPYLTFIIYSSEMQNHCFSFPCVIKGKVTLIPQFLGRQKRTLHPRKGRFDSKRNENLSLELHFFFRCILSSNRILP